LLVFFLVALLTVSHRWLPFSDLSYLLLFIFLCIHEIGAHYQYAGALPLSGSNHSCEQTGTTSTAWPISRSVCFWLITNVKF